MSGVRDLRLIGNLFANESLLGSMGRKRGVGALEEWGKVVE